MSETSQTFIVQTDRQTIAVVLLSFLLGCEQPWIFKTLKFGMSGERCNWGISYMKTAPLERGSSKLEIFTLKL